MPRERTGYVEWRDGRWKTHCRVGPDKCRMWIELEKDVPPVERLQRDQKALAQNLAVVIQQRIELGGYVPAERDITVNEFFTRWSIARKAKYPGQVKRDEAAYRLWIADEIGTLPLRAVSRERLIELAHKLDQIAVEGVDFREKRARNIFSVVAALFRDAYSSKDRSLRLLTESPMVGVPWPDRGAGAPLKQMLYPAELVALVSCPTVPLVRARLYAVTLYTMMRGCEVRILECPQVDIAYGNVKVLKADDRTTAASATKLTKSGKARIVSLEPTLAPVLHEMIAERGGKGRLFLDRPAETAQANQWRPASGEFIPGPDGAYGLCGTFKRDLRAALAWAAIAERPELFDDSDRRVSLSIRFHDLRASGITWRHARGDNPSLIRQECGHEDQATNEIYIRALRGLPAGSLFPALPERLLGGRRGLPSGAEGPGSKDPAMTQLGPSTPVLPGYFVGAEGFEPPTSTV